MASFISLSSPSYLSPTSPRFKCLGARTRVLVLPAKCLSSGPREETESKPETKRSLSSSLSSSSSTYNWCAGIGGVGFIETAYLSYLKLTNSDAFCPSGGGNCGDVLNSDYAVVFGITFDLK
ncbi:hypothetical protein Pint_28598 [Pistacia integerrima]|uniref:Uncharacterized protein n=1 Tax=Pistacia integerrima TaxID=434235 RepID=A0ACC0YSV5_9ROSI|nr:hypothetical protein Pint_28598 [Pistacia integerrima]